MTLANYQTLEESRATWTKLYSKTLPMAAKARSDRQPMWPVSLDHCFARIILDNAVGVDVPWMSKIQSPAYKHMTKGQLDNAIEMGERILAGDVSLVELNRRSLALRGKKGPKRARARSDEEELRIDSKVPRVCEDTIKQACHDAKGSANPRVADQVEVDIKGQSVRDGNVVTKQILPISFDISVLDATTDLTPFRRKVLQLLYTVPRGRWTTYKAMSDALASSPRAVGNAIRNNPYAPYIPCHRVLASDGSIGGFGGDWGKGGRHYAEKVKLLRAEGVRFDGRGKVVGRPYTFNQI